ncbi:MAG: PilZ domain-containing protein [Kofleriaceae bacterium]
MEVLTRRAVRHRLEITATAQPLLGGEIAVCRTKDVSLDGTCLTTAAWFPIGTRLALTMTDPFTGTAFEVIGDVVREAAAPGWTLGIAMVQPPAEWRALVTAAARASNMTMVKPGPRLRVLVVGDEHRQRGALALYVTSGWDVLFASDDDSIHDAVSNIDLDLVIAELDGGDARVDTIMDTVRRVRPKARRIQRGSGDPSSQLIHRFVDRDSGLEALLDAVAADVTPT